MSFMPNIQPIQNNPSFQPQRNLDEEYKNLSLQINTKMQKLDRENPKGLVKQSLKNALGLNFNNFNNPYSRNLQNFDVEKIYFLSHNLRSNLEKNKIPQPNFDISKYNARKFEQISNNILGREKNYYKQFIEANGSIGLNDLNNINNITSELKKINENNPFNYLQENSDFDFNNNKLGIYLLLQLDGKTGKIFNNNNSTLSTKDKRCNEHMRRKMLKNRDKKKEKFNNFIDSKNFRNSNLGGGIGINRSKDRFSDDIRNSSNISYIKPKKNYLVEEESNLFEKYFNSLIPYFKELINEKKMNQNDKILKLREVLDINIGTFREGRKNFCELMKTLITPLNNGEGKNGEINTKILINRIIKYLEKDYQRKNYRVSQTQNMQRKEDFITNYANNIIYTYFSYLTTQSQSKTLILWAKIFYFLRFGWKKECIDFINQIEGIYISESGLREIKDSLDENRRINIQNYNEFKRILNQDKKEENPFKHACMVYMTKIADKLSDNILLEINDHLWFNLNLIYPSDNYNHLIINKDLNEEFEIDTSSNPNKFNNDNEILKLIKLKDLQNFFESQSVEDIISSNKKNTNFVYIILMTGLLKFKTALLFMIKNNMYEDAINFYFFLKQIGIYNNFEEINDKKINKFSLKNNNISKEEIYQIFPRVSNNIPALMLYIRYSDENFIHPLSYLLLETEALYVLDNYYRKIMLFKNDNNNNKKNKNIEINSFINNSFNFCLMDIMDEATLIKLCKNIFELLLVHKVRNNENLNPLFNTFKELRMLTELTGILINKSIELLNMKKPKIENSNNGKFSIKLDNEKNRNYFGYSLILNCFGGLINDVDQLFIEKQNELNILTKNNQYNENNNEKIFLINKEIEDNNIPISLLKQLPIIENIYENIFKGDFKGAFKLFIDNIYLVKIGFDSDENDYLNEFNGFINEGLKKLKYGLLGLYPDILYLFVWDTKIYLDQCYKQGYINIIKEMKNNCKALEYLLDKLVEISRNDNELMNYSDIFQNAKIEVNQIQQFYQQNNFNI